MPWTIAEEEWEGPRLHGLERVIEDEAEAVAAFDRLDGRHKTQMTLEDPSAVLCVGGGLNGRYVLFVGLNRDESLFTLVDPQPAGAAEVELTVGGQAGVYAARHCVDRPLALAAVRYFFRYGVPDPSLTWENG